MGDPLSQLVGLLHPRAVFANVISGKGEWAVRFAAYGQPGFCIVLEGGCRLAVQGHAPVAIEAGDFILLPTTPAFTLSSGDEVRPLPLDPAELPSDGSEVRYGEPGDAPGMRSLGGTFAFDEADPALLVSLLPAVVHVRGSARLSRLVEMVAQETVEPRPGGAAVLSRLAELLLIEAMRATSSGDAPQGLLRGLGGGRRGGVFAAGRAAADRGDARDQQRRRAAGPAPRSGRRAPRGRAAADARVPRAALDGGAAGHGRRAVALELLRALHPHRRRRADGIPAGLAHGDREGSAAAGGVDVGAGRRTHGLRIGERVQRGVPAARGDGAGAVCGVGAGPGLRRVPGASVRSSRLAMDG